MLHSAEMSAWHGTIALTSICSVQYVKLSQSNGSLSQRGQVLIETGEAILAPGEQEFNTEPGNLSDHSDDSCRLRSIGWSYCSRYSVTVTPVGMILSLIEMLQVPLLLAPVLVSAVLEAVVVEMVQSQAPDCQG